MSDRDKKRTEKLMAFQNKMGFKRGPMSLTDLLHMQVLLAESKSLQREFEKVFRMFEGGS